MNRTVRRLIAALLITALLAGSVCAVDANTEQRHTTASALSAAAKRYYTGAFSFQDLCSLAGKSTNKSDAAMDSSLYLSLQALMFGSLTTQHAYEDLPRYWYISDTTGGRTGTTLFYSDVFQSKGGYLVREHVWAKSHGTFNETGAGSDLHHMRPENYDVNSARSNYTFGNVKEKSDPPETQSYGGRDVLWYLKNNPDKDCKGLVEVADDVKGDVARILLYVYVTYGQPNLCTRTASSGDGSEYCDGRKVIENLDILLEWCRSDPVDTWEMQRNDIVQALQGNRNVFIDYPELAWLLFDRPLPDMPTPSGYAKRNHGSGFLDVPRDAWYAQGVDFAAEEGLMNGVGHRRFAPGQVLTRAQLVTVLYRWAESPHIGTARNRFTDVPKGKWYTNAVIWADREGVMKGFPDGSFRPDAPITREQLVTVLYRFRGGKPAPVRVLNPFPDRDEVSKYAREAMRWAVAQGLISGIKQPKGDPLLSPKTGTTRAQFSVIMQRLLDR